MYNRLDRHVSPERKAFIESCRTAPRIQQETRFTFDPFESDGTNIEVQEKPIEKPRIDEIAVIVVSSAFIIAALLIGAAWIGIN